MSRTLSPPAPRLVALASPAPGSGKSEVAKYLVERKGFSLVKFAGPLKAMTRTFFREFGMSPAEIETRIEGKWKEDPIPAIGGASARRVMVTLGTEWGRDQIDQNLWVRVTMARVRQILLDGRSVVIDDMRFQNEQDAVIETGGQCFAVMRPGYRELMSTHVSEGALRYDTMGQIQNDSTIAALRRRVDALLP